MAMSIVFTPELIAPVNKPMYFNFSSTTSMNPNYKYILLVKDSVANTLGAFKVPPTPYYGMGRYTPHRVLKSIMSDTTDESFYYINTPTWTDLSNGLNRYSIQYGEEYNPLLSWYDTQFLSGGYLGLTFSAPIGSNLLVGDIITLNKDNKTINPTYDGTCSVTQIVNSFTIKTDKTFLNNSNLESGKIIGVQRLVGTTSNFYAYNGTNYNTLTNKQFNNPDNSYSYTKFIIVGGSQPAVLPRFMSNWDYTQPKKIKLDEGDMIQVLLDTTASNSYLQYKSNYNGTPITLTYSVGVITQPTTLSIQVGPKNIGITALNNVDTYTLCMKSSAGVTSSQTYTYKLDNSCSLYNSVRVSFMNSFGHYEYFTFTLDYKESYDINKKEYTKINDGANSQFLGYQSKVFAQDVMVKGLLNSNWISESEYYYLKDLLLSPNAYIVDVNGFIPILITDTNYSLKTNVRDRLFNLQINFKYAIPYLAQNL